MLKIHIISGLGNGGAEEMLLRLIRSDNKSDENIIISLNSKRNNKVHEFTGAGIKVLIPSDKFFWVRLFFLISKLFIDRNFNLIGWMYHGSFVASLMGLITFRRPVFNIRHSLYDIKKEKKSTQYIIFLLKFLSYFSRIVVYNSNLAKHQHQLFGFSSRNSIFIPNGLDCSEISIAHNKRYNPFVIGHMARYHPMKGHLVFIQSMLSLMEDGFNIRVNMAGSGLSNSLAERVILDSSHSDKFNILDHVSDRSNFFNSINLFVSSSLWGEGFSNVILEAGAYAVPVIATDVGDASVILDGYYKVIPANCPKSIALEVKKYIMFDYASVEAKGLEFSNKIAINFDISDISKKYFESWML